MRPKSLKSHADILTVAAELFSKKGYRATTMQDIAKRLKVSKPTLYASTTSKEAILGEIIESWIDFTEDGLQKAIKAPGSPRKRLQALVEIWSRNAVSQRAFHMVFLADERELPPAIVAKYRRWSIRAFHRIRDCVREGQSAGVFRPELDASIVTFSLVAFINSLPEWFDAKGKLTIDQIAQQYIELLEVGSVVDAERPRKKSKLEDVPRQISGASA
jgi:AcrR family transcriptional regulator